MLINFRKDSERVRELHEQIVVNGLIEECDECGSLDDLDVKGWLEKLQSLDEQTEIEGLCHLWKMDKDEKLCRKAMIKAWIKLLEKYSKPGAVIPPAHVVRKELLDTGVKAAVKAYCDEHWWAFSGAVRGEIKKKVEKGLNKIDIVKLIADVKIAQTDRQMFDYLKAQIERWVMEA